MGAWPQRVEHLERRGRVRAGPVAEVRGAGPLRAPEAGPVSVTVGFTAKGRAGGVARAGWRGGTGSRSRPGLPVALTAPPGGESRPLLAGRVFLGVPECRCVPVYGSKVAMLRFLGQKVLPRKSV